MLKSPMKLSTRPNARDYQLVDGETMVRGVPPTDRLIGEVPFVNADIDIGDDEFDLVGHGLIEGQPITFREDGGLPTGTDVSNVFFVVYVDADHFGICKLGPGNSKEALTADATGTNYIQARERAKYVLPVNYGAVPVGIRPIVGNTYAMDTDNEFVLHHNCGQQVPLNVTGCDSIAAEAIGGAGDLRVTPLENG